MPAFSGNSRQAPKRSDTRYGHIPEPYAKTTLSHLSLPDLVFAFMVFYVFQFEFELCNATTLEICQWLFVKEC